MRFACKCGYTIRDQTDQLSYKARFVPDQSWFGLLDNLEAIALNNSADEKSALPDALWINLSGELSSVTSTAYECRQCGRIWFDRRGYPLVSYCPENSASWAGIFQAPDDKLDSAQSA